MASHATCAIDIERIPDRAHAVAFLEDRFGPIDDLEALVRESELEAVLGLPDGALPFLDHLGLGPEKRIGEDGIWRFRLDGVADWLCKSQCMEGLSLMITGIHIMACLVELPESRGPMEGPEEGAVLH